MACTNDAVLFKVIYCNVFILKCDLSYNRCRGGLIKHRYEGSCSRE